MRESTAVVMDLGDKNKGIFGPTEDTLQHWESFEESVTSVEYRKKPNNRTACVDGRLPGEGVAADAEYADSRMPGSEPVTNTAGDMMNPATVGTVRLGDRVAINVRQTVAADKTPVFHGDNHKGSNGCAAKVAMRPTLRSNVENMDIVAPRTWAMVGAFDLNEWVTEEDVTDAIIAGGKNANDEAVWDATPAEMDEIAKENGAEYQILLDDHEEEGVAATLDPEEVMDTIAYAEDHIRPDGSISELFGATLGKYVQDTMHEGVKNGLSLRDSALKAMRGLTYTLGLCKEIGDKELRIIAMGKAYSAKNDPVLAQLSADNR